MKRGCFMLLFIWAAFGVGYFLLLQGTEFESPWVAVGFGFAFMLLFAQLQGITQWLRYKRATARDPQSWLDGVLVGLSGQLRAVKGSVQAPFSGRDCALVEYEIKRITTSTSGGKTSQNSVIEYTGMRMPQCAVHTMRGATRVVGFPILNRVPEEEYTSQQGYRRAADYLLSTKIEPRDKNIGKLLKQLTDVLSDDDGEVKADYGDPAPFAPDSTEGGAPSEARRAEAAEYLAAQDFCLYEKVIPNGAHVTVFGTYRQARQVVDIGSAHKNIDHQLHLGKQEEVLGRLLRNSVIGVVVMLAIVGAANWGILNALGYDPLQLIEEFRNKFAA